MSKVIPYKANEEDKTALIDEFLQSAQNFSQTEQTLIRNAWTFLCEKCKDKVRSCKSPYYLHPLRLCYILLSEDCDAFCIVGGLLHSVFDLGVNKEELQSNFGQVITKIIEGVQRLTDLNAQSTTLNQADAIRKMLFALCDDIRVILIKVADRLDRIRNITSLETAKRRVLAREVIDIWAPLSDRLGMQRIKNELEDLSLKYSNPKAFEQIKSVVSAKKGERAEFLNTAVKSIKEKTDVLGLDIEITARAKHFYSIYQKMRKRNKEISELFDLFALRIICNTQSDCYTILGIVHALYKPLDNRFKDYIAMPKGNGYQSLHTTVMCADKPLEVQIRTHKMHDIAEHGVASHWLYKAGTNHDCVKINDLDIFNKAQNIKESSLKDDSAFENYKDELLKDEIFVFTPKGQVKKLPQGSCAIDFAYAIHSAIGEKIVGAKANGKIISISAPLQNTQIIEILTNPQAHPTQSQLSFVKTSKAHQKIHSWLVFNDPSFNDSTTEKLRAAKLSDTTPEESPSVKATNERHAHKRGKAATQAPIATPKAVKVDGVSNVVITFAKCCSPVYPNLIAGYVSRLRGVVIHRADCLTYLRIPEADKRKVQVEWE